MHALSLPLPLPPPPRARWRPRWPLARALVVFALIILMLPPGSAVAASDVRTLRRFDTSEPAMALTFDAGSDRGYAAQILDTLAARGVVATFAITGAWAQANPDLVRRIANEGHQLVNHSWSHPSFPTLSSAARADQLARAAAAIRDASGADPRPWFRPPYGAYDDATLADLAANGYIYNLMWTVDTLGWNGASVSQITARALAAAAPGAIVLMHVGAASLDAAALPGMLDGLEARGYRFARARDFVEGNLGTTQYFPQTGQTVGGGFLAYWRRFGGLAIFGYPLTGELQENGRTVQYFERARFEWQPGAWPERYDVLLGRLGAELTAGRVNEAPFLSVVAGSDANCTFYPEAGHRLCLGFRAYWQANGGLAIFGYPLSQEFQEFNPDTGQTHTVQYFERARFEYHPENAGTPYTVLLGRIGAQRLAAR